MKPSLRSLFTRRTIDKMLEAVLSLADDYTTK